MQPRKFFMVKIMKIKASWGLLKVWGPWGSIPCSPPPPLSQWAWSLALHCTITHINMLTDWPSHLVFDLKYDTLPWRPDAQKTDLYVKSMMPKFFCLLCFPLLQTVIPKFVDYSSIVSGVPETQPRTPEEVLWKQLDIIVMLAERGVPLDHADNAGHSASFRACHELEVSFLEGAILLGEENNTRQTSQLGPCKLCPNQQARCPYFKEKEVSSSCFQSLSTRIICCEG